MERRPGFVLPLLLITIGSILLFDKMGVIHWGSWGSLWQYWPVILILWGIEILARHSKSDVVYFTGVIICILVIIGSVWLASSGYPPQNIRENNMKGFIFTGKNLEGKDFNFADLDKADFNNSNLNGSNMNFASVKYANLSNSSLSGANLNFADMHYAKLDNANLAGANLNFANLAFADLRNSGLDGANLNFVDLEGANMAGASLNGSTHVFAGTSKSTICPDSTNGPCW
ncbi:MAG: pentapeptide repeat-containing protein [Candidatus Methanoperedens sp.]|nr:pentapeptide repeat-containing protein [Candidatus Methanoperedens sp.]